MGGGGGGHRPPGITLYYQSVIDKKPINRVVIVSKVRISDACKSYVIVIFTENVEVSLVNGPQKKSSNKVSAVEIEVQIIDLKDYYHKKRVKHAVKGLEYRLQDSKVTVIIQASEDITNVSAYTQRCAVAAIRTHDTIGRLLKRCFGSVSIAGIVYSHI